VVPQEIPYALGAERACEEAHVPYPAAAFLAGLHYDWLAAVIKKRKGSSDEKGVLESSFKAGLLTAKAGFNLGSQLSDIELGKYLYASGLLVHLGKVLMNLLFPKASEANSWANFVYRGRRLDSSSLRSLCFFREEALWNYPRGTFQSPGKFWGPTASH
jgi:hypothetical protein